MDLKEAEKLADEFTEWAGDLLKESAEGANLTIRWFIKTLYKEGYEIRKKL